MTTWVCPVAGTTWVSVEGIHVDYVLQDLWRRHAYGPNFPDIYLDFWFEVES